MVPIHEGEARGLTCNDTRAPFDLKLEVGREISFIVERENLGTFCRVLNQGELSIVARDGSFVRLDRMEFETSGCSSSFDFWKFCKIKVEVFPGIYL